MTELSTREKIDWLRLARSENVGPVTFTTLLKYYKSAGEALKAIPEMAAKGGQKRKIAIPSLSLIEKEYENTIKLGGDVIASIEPAYPQLLKQIHDFPTVISILGHKNLLNRQAVAIVGSRNATLNGKQIAKKLAYDLSDSGYAVVSGMAMGIDRNAHEGALAHENGATMGVLGCGIDVVYPRENQDIYDELKERGVIISDFPLGMSPHLSHFPRRNRIISGLSLGTLVIEAQKRSGSLITARLALEHNREVFAVPSSPLDPRGQGPNQLIKQGAHLVESVRDILDVLENMPRLQLSEPEEEFCEEIVKPTEADIDRARKIVLENLSPNAIGVDEIIRETGFSHSLVSFVLLELGIAGRIEWLPGNKVSLVIG